jgi:DNA-binding transcriptional LysR family regulator
MENKQKSLAFRMLVFREVLQQGTFTGAAEVLQLTKSGLSQHVAQLERDVGAQLLVRSTRRLRLTEAGRQFLTRCHEMHSLLALACDEVQQWNERPTGLLRVTVPHALAVSVMLPAVLQLTERFPGLEMDLRTEDEVVDVVRDGIDLALRVGALPSSPLRAKKVGELQGLLVASPRYLAAAPEITTVQTLSVHPFILSHWQQHRPLRVHDAQGQGFDLPVQARFKVDSAAMACELVRQDRGIALLPNLQVKDDLQKGRMAVVLPELRQATEPIHTVHRYQSQPPLAIRWLQRFIGEQLSRSLL